MPTQLLHPVRLLTAFYLFTTALSTGTTYKCNSQTAPMFHQDCVVAANQLVLSLTRDDSQTHIPNDDITHSYMNCHATLQASGGEKVVQGTSILLSFAQIGARCQDGSFSAEGGAIDGSLVGTASWKRSGRSIQAKAKRALSAPLRFFRRDMHDVQEPQGQQLRKRTEMMGARKGSNGEVYKLMIVSSHGVPNLAPSSPQVSSMFFQRSKEFLQHQLQRGDTSDLVFGNAYPIQGDTHVSVISLGVKLRGGQTSWKQFLESQGDAGKTIKDLIMDGLTMFTSNKFVAAYFHVLNGSGQQVFSFMIYGYDSVDSPLP